MSTYEPQSFISTWNAKSDVFVGAFGCFDANPCAILLILDVSFKIMATKYDELEFLNKMPWCCMLCVHYGAFKHMLSLNGQIKCKIMLIWILWISMFCYINVECIWCGHLGAFKYILRMNSQIGSIDMFAWVPWCFILYYINQSVFLKCLLLLKTLLVSSMDKNNNSN